jgi:hypothetical protein
VYTRTSYGLSRMEHIALIAYFFAFIHRSAWKGNSANFALTEFSEIRGYKLPRSARSGGFVRGRGYAGSRVPNSAY